MLHKFSEFVKKYNKNYATREEFAKRFEIFVDNYHRIDDLNRRYGSIHNVTKFSDLTVEEFRKYPCGVDKLSDLNSRRPDFVPTMNTERVLIAPDIPASWDWTTKGKVTPVKNQEQCGSCWAFSVIGNTEGVQAVQDNVLTGLSEQQIVSCSTTDYGCEGGWPFWAFADMLAAPYNGQLDTEAGYPYTSGDGDNGNCEFQTNDVGATLTGYKNYCNEQTAACTEVQMQQLLVTYGPLSVCLDAGPMQVYQGGIDNPTDCDPNAIDHCVTMVGYGTEGGVDFWKMKNSWGTDWGEAGFYRLIRGIGACGINKVITIAQVK